MLTIEGTYKNGQVVLSNPPGDVAEAKVLVTFLDTTTIDLRERGIDEIQAADLRSRLAAVTDDWSMPEMDIYDAD